MIYNRLGVEPSPKVTKKEPFDVPTQLLMMDALAFDMFGL